jgi:ubiquinone/menaquinone biosynthesis C-methylase UbiE
MNGLSFPEMCERWLVGPIFQPWATVVFDRSGVAPGDRVPDIACGTGSSRLTMRRLSGRGRVVGVDSNGEMLDAARNIEPAVDWREGNASALPAEDTEQFDLVVCHQAEAMTAFHACSSG